MSSQFDSFYSKEDGCIVSCGCGSINHGMIQFHEDLHDEPNDEELTWCDLSGCWISVRVTPIYGRQLFGSYKLGNFIERVRQCIHIFKGQSIPLDYFISAKTAGELGEWLCESRDKSNAMQKVADDSPKMTLGELREKLKNERDDKS